MASGRQETAPAGPQWTLRSIHDPPTAQSGRIFASSGWIQEGSPAAFALAPCNRCSWLFVRKGQLASFQRRFRAWKAVARGWVGGGPTLGRLLPRLGSGAPCARWVAPARGMPRDVPVGRAPFHGSHPAVFREDRGASWEAPDLLWEGPDLLWEGPDLSWQARGRTFTPPGPDLGSAGPDIYTPGALPGEAGDSPKERSRGTC